MLILQTRSKNYAVEEQKLMRNGKFSIWKVAENVLFDYQHVYFFHVDFKKPVVKNKKSLQIENVMQELNVSTAVIKIFYLTEEVCLKRLRYLQQVALGAL